MAENTDDDINDGLDNTKKAMEVVGELMKTAGDNPKVREAGDNLGQAALTVTKTINNALIPLAAVNYGFDKARRYFSDKFEKDLAEKADKIPQEDIVEPKASIAGPALQGLAFTHEEENLKEMYLSLLTTAMNGNTADSAHPAFVEIIRQLTSQEAHLLKGILASSNPIPICEVKLQDKGKTTWNSLYKHLVNLTNSETKEPVENEQFPSMIENWIRLGLIEVSYTNYLSDMTKYDWAKTRPEVEKLRTMYEDETHEVTFQNGIVERTSFGKLFAKAVDI